MSTSLHAFAAETYGVRAQDYVTSAVHGAGPDLDQIEAELYDAHDARVLDLGCGGGHVSYRASPHVRDVVACDVTPAMLDAVRTHAAARGLANIATQLAPAEHLPFPDASFDWVLCRFTAHHWQDLEAGLRQARRVLKRGGRAIFVDSVAPEDALLDTHLQTVEVLRDPSHVRNYRLSEWLAALCRARFVVEGVVSRKLRMDFQVWTARTRTPQSHADVIRSLQRATPPQVREHFAVDEGGSFDLDVATITVRAA